MNAEQIYGAFLIAFAICGLIEIRRVHVARKRWANMHRRQRVHHEDYLRHHHPLS